jgi:hypothetical protein
LLTEILPSTLERPLNPLDLARWLTSHAEPIRERWLAYLVGRAQDHDGVEELLDAFLEVFLDALPELMGAYREQLEPLWTQAAELFGSMACSRGLAAGEAVEEAQFLRETIMRLLYQSPPRVSQGAMGLRDILRLNRAVDQLVTHASVGHTDALFFALFQGSGVPERLSDDVRYEIRSQLEGLKVRMDEILGPRD